MAYDPASADPRALGERLRGYIRASGKTQAKVAEEIGTDPTYVSQLVNGRVNWVKSDYFRKLAEVLDLTVEDITELNPDMVISTVSRRVVETTSNPDPFAGFPEPLYKKRDEIYMPEGLLDAIKMFGDVPEYADLKNPDVQRQLANHRGFDGGPQTAGQWLAFFQANKPWITNKD
jgi:transcriptional regulator with XRE-family HTH domain